MELFIKSEIVRCNKKLKDVAAATGIPKDTFYRKANKNTFTLPEALRIAKVLGKTLTMVDN